MPAPKGHRPPNAGKGRKAGVPNKTTAAVKEMVLTALSNVGGVSYLEDQADKNPTAFLTLVGKILPTELTGGNGGPLQVQDVPWLRERRL